MINTIYKTVLARIANGNPIPGVDAERVEQVIREIHDLCPTYMTVSGRPDGCEISVTTTEEGYPVYSLGSLNWREFAEVVVNL